MKLPARKIIPTLIGLSIATCPIALEAKPAQSRKFGLQAPFQIQDLPEGQLRKKLSKLSSKRRNRAMQWLHTFTFDQHDLDQLTTDNNGAILYADSYLPDEITNDTTSTLDQPQPITAVDAFTLHSKPGAKNIIYLDFNGHVLSGTAWNSSSTSITAKAFDTDGNPANFSSTELNQIAETWHRIAEDYAPFNVDVTTQEPAAFSPTVGRILITHNKDINGQNMPYSTAGGVAYVGVWGRSDYHTRYSPALVYYNNLASNPTYMAEASSHELGHNLGLSHDGTSTSSYYTGHGTGFVSWGPIMGIGYSKNVTQWSKGEYTGATQLQDDLSIINNKLTYRTDDHGNTIDTPTPLLINADGDIVSTNPESDPHNSNPDNKGIIETRSDVDFFAFDAGTGPLNINVSPAWEAFYRSSRRGANLDIKATLYDWDGNAIAQSDPADDTDANIAVSVQAGQYLLSVTGVGNTTTPYSDYASLGQYFISGNVMPFGSGNDTAPPAPNPMGWSAAPTANSSRDSITMSATIATDESGTVEYQFICAAGAKGCISSDWQSSHQYTISGLQAGASYSFQVKARDAHGNETQLSTIGSATTTSNHFPTVTNGNVTVQEDKILTIHLNEFVQDQDGDLITYTITSASAQGALVNNNNGTVTYTPKANYNGTDKFTYSANDGHGGSANGTVNITVIPVNDAPVAKAGFTPGNVNPLSVGFFSTGSFDPDTGDSISYFWNFGNGSTSTEANPQYSYSEGGTYSVSLKVTDRDGLSSTSSLSVTVTKPVNPVPATPTNLSIQVQKFISGLGRIKNVTGIITLTWDASPNAKTYNIWRCEERRTGSRRNRRTECVYDLTPYQTTQSPSFTETLSSSAYRYKVTAVNGVDESGFSNEVRIRL